MRIILYDNAYRDDMIFMVLQAKDALGRRPHLNDDLLSVEDSYFRTGDMFWLAIDEQDRVVGCIGYHRMAGTAEAFLHRLYVKPDRKRQGIGSMLLQTAEETMRAQGIVVSHVHLGEPKEQWFESYAFYPKHGYWEYKPRYMKKPL